jgi:hypothetical protein
VIRMTTQREFHLTLTEALEVLRAWWHTTGKSKADQDRDYRDLLTYFTIRLGDGRELRKSGVMKYALVSPEPESIPGAWIEEWMGS